FRSASRRESNPAGPSRLVTMLPGSAPAERRSSSRTRRRQRRRRARADASRSSSLRSREVVTSGSNLEFVTPIPRPGGLTVPGIERAFLTVGDHVESTLVHALPRQIPLRRGCAAIAESQIVLVAATLVAVAGDLEPHGRVCRENGGLAIEDALIGGANVGLVELEMDQVGQLAPQSFGASFGLALQPLGVVVGRWRWWRGFLVGPRGGLGRRLLGRRLLAASRQQRRSSEDAQDRGCAHQDSWNQGLGATTAAPASRRDHAGSRAQPGVGSCRTRPVSASIT